jgi:outer membrane murein-binding lipoprotein Lpp
MGHRNDIWKPIGLLSISLALLSGCAGGVPQSEYNAVKEQLASQEQKSAAFQQELSAKVQEVSDLQKKVAELEQQKGAPSDVTVLIGARTVPTPTPAPPPTLPPPGFTPPPRPGAPATYYEPVGPFFLYVETLATTRPSKYGVAATISCVPNSVFKRGQRIVWRFEIIDTTSGVRVTDKDEATIKIKLPNGDEATARWSQRAGGRVPDAPWMWNATWDVPLDSPLGSLDYSIAISTKDGRTGSWKAPALVAKDTGTDSRVQIID